MGRLVWLTELPKALKVGPDVEGAEVFVCYKDADPFAELGRQLREEDDTAIEPAIVYECVGQCDAKSCCEIVDSVVGLRTLTLT